MKLLTVFMILSGCFVLFGHAPAAQAEATEAALVHRIDIAGRQRMLSQRMGMAACFVMGNVEAASYADIARQAYDALAVGQRTLRQGDPRQDIEAERDPAVLVLLDRSDAIFDTFGRAVLQVSHQDLQSVVIAQVTNLDFLMLEQLNLTVSAIEHQRVSATQGAQLIKTIDIAGRQRMLSQKVLKEYCYVSLGVDTRRQQQQMATTIKMFERSLELLETGSDEHGVLAPPNVRAKGRLARVRSIWERLAPILQSAVSGKDVDPADLQRAAGFSEDLLKASQHAVASYLKL
ncbi:MULTISPECIES: type IV pili methyl-accepting chemotaxis transducer N-terminal domain-containing protein [Roseobacteraceae]|uniref:NarX-like N-terminal domain-containing protein n=1 Tax=Pseudosulfitobacter pseudonitzschiae TaxID=1402135 RepID=A0A221JYR6_9RHOB|nr:MULTISPECIES: type IV pili methyl-accepting chemotaxis transducer N-terminal domain-containing protein [Roseobacteraceae]ASM71895.1 hypothetical protein SULPSESMR1_01070 [Pseudosulfitobacter pseudonitzschiae]